jgi:hypothetical protein
MSTRNSCTGGKKINSRRKGGMLGTPKEYQKFNDLPDDTAKIKAIYEIIIQSSLNESNRFEESDNYNIKLWNIFKIVEQYIKTLDKPYTSPPLPPRVTPRPEIPPPSRRDPPAGEEVIGEVGKLYHRSVNLRPPEGYYIHQRPTDLAYDGEKEVNPLPQGMIANPYPQTGYYNPKTVVYHRGGRKQSTNKNKK